RHLPRLACGLARLRGVDALLGDPPGGGRILLEDLGQLVVDDRLHQAADLAVTELGLRLALELRLRQANRDDRAEPFPDVIAGDPALEVLEEAVGLRVCADRARQRGAEAGEVGPALPGVDVVREREHELLVAVVVLERHLDLGVAPPTLEVEHLRVNGGLVLVDVLDELADAAGVVEGDLLLVPLVLDLDPEALVQERELAEPVGQDVEREGRDLEDLGIRLEPDRGAALGRLLAGLQLALRLAAVVPLRVEAAVPPDLQLEPLRQGVHDRHPDPVEAARHLVDRALELAPGVERGQDDLGGRLAGGLVDVDRDPAPVVDDGAAAVSVEDDADVRAVAGERLVDRVVHHLEHEVMETVGRGVPDVHRGALAHGLEALEDLDVAGGVALGPPPLLARLAHAIPRASAALASTAPPCRAQTAPRSGPSATGSVAL